MKGVSSFAGNSSVRSLFLLPLFSFAFSLSFYADGTLGSKDAEGQGRTCFLEADLRRNPFSSLSFFFSLSFFLLAARAWFRSMNKMRYVKREG